MKPMRPVWRVVGAAALGLAASLGPLAPVQATSPAAAAGLTNAAAPRCDRSVYLTFDTGHMGVAPLVADVLARHQVKVTFFLANERTRNGGASLDDEWAPWWKARAAEGHAFGSHTWDHDVWRADVAGGTRTDDAITAGGDAGAKAGARSQGALASGTPVAFRVKPTMGPQAGRERTLTPQAYCLALKEPARRFQAMTGQPMSAIFRAPGGKTSPALLRAADECGFTHVGWTPAGFLGDELPSDRYPNERLLQQALRDVKAGDILLAHLGIWSRQDPWAPAVLEPLITGLKARGLCFATLREHPSLGAAARRAVAP